MTIKEQQAHALRQELLTVKQASLLTQYHEQSLYRLIAQGKIAIVRVGKWGIRIPRSALRAVREHHPRADQSIAL